MKRREEEKRRDEEMKRERESVWRRDPKGERRARGERGSMRSVIVHTRQPARGRQGCAARGWGHSLKLNLEWISVWARWAGVCGSCAWP